MQEISATLKGDSGMYNNNDDNAMSTELEVLSIISCRYSKVELLSVYHSDAEGRSYSSYVGQISSLIVSAESEAYYDSFSRTKRFPRVNIDMAGRECVIFDKTGFT